MNERHEYKITKLRLIEDHINWLRGSIYRLGVARGESREIFDNCLLNTLEGIYNAAEEVKVFRQDLAREYFNEENL